MIDVRIHQWCATLEVDDFAPLTRYDAAFTRALRDAVVELSDHDEVKVIVLRARDRDFAPGTDTTTPSTDEVTTTWHRDFAASSAIYQSLCFAKKVVVTEVTGECHGAGSLVVLCSDLTVATENARFGSPFTDLPESNFVLAALTMRLNRAKAWMLRGTVLDAEQARVAGLVNHVVPADELSTATAELTGSITGMPLDGVTMSKMLLQSVLDTHGVGRDFDLADHYALHRATAAGPAS